MLISRLYFFAFLAITFSLANCARPIPPDTIRLRGALDKPGDWNAARIKSELAGELKPIEYTSHGEKHRCTCVPLLALLKASGAHTDLKMDPKASPSAKNYPLRLTIQVQGSDGYTASFSLAELLPEIGNKEAWLALDADNQPLPAGEGPLRLIIPSDLKPGRWVHAVKSIAIIDNTR